MQQVIPNFVREVLEMQLRYAAALRATGRAGRREIMTSGRRSTVLEQLEKF
jgi:hypothetical protein